ncbi:MAG: hypothetical protein ACT4OM_10315 [Actinomycetota bacterium]
MSDEVIEGIGEPANQMTLGERPVSDQDIEALRRDLAQLRRNLDELRSGMSDPRSPLPGGS